MNKNSSIALAIETSTQRGSACLSVAGEKILSEMNEPNSQARLIIPKIEQMFNGAGIWYGDLTHLAVVVGPGSFSGLRIGLSVAQMIADAHPHIALQCYTALECVMAGYDGVQELVCAVIPAGKGDVYCQRFSRNVDGLWQAEGEIALCSPAEGLAYADGRPLVGHGNTLLIPDTPQGMWPRADYLTDAHKKLLTHEAWALKPLYIRPPDAKVSNASRVTC